MARTLDPDSIKEIRLGQIADLSTVALLRQFRGVHPGGFLDGWAALLPELATVFLSTQIEALDASVEYLTELAGSPVSLQPVEYVDKVGASTLEDFLNVTPRAFLSRVNGGMSDVQALVATANRLAGSVATEPHRVDRGATIDTASKDSRFKGWARIAEAGACDFCRMLASRGAVYQSQATAATQASGQRYHVHCRCQAKALPRGSGAADWDGTGTKGGGKSKVAAQASDFNQTKANYRPGAKTAERAACVRRELTTAQSLAASRPSEWATATVARLESEHAALVAAGF
jgi:hypothetical protein